MGLEATSLVLLPVGLGLLGFVEPCSLGATLIVVKHIEDKRTFSKIAAVGTFALTRAAFIGLLGILAVVVGSGFLWMQRGAWIALGAVYVIIGLLYLTGRIGFLMRSVGPKLRSLSGVHTSAWLGVLLGLNVPACATPLLIVLLGMVAAGGAAGAALASGFLSLALFGLALSLPLVIAVLIAPARRGLDWLAALSGRLPVWTGLLLIALGAWSIGFGLFAHITL
jgi:cytochrome c-type biogenesis protein